MGTPAAGNEPIGSLPVRPARKWVSQWSAISILAGLSALVGITQNLESQAGTSTAQ